MTTPTPRTPTVPESGEETRPSAFLSPAARVWALTGAIVALTAYLWVGHIRHLDAVRSPFQIYWPVLAALFYVTEIYVVHFEIKRDAHSFSLSEIPLVLGLFFVSPATFVVAQLVGAAVALGAHRRQSPLKLFFNLGHFCLEASLAVLVFHRLLGGAPPISTRGVFAAMAASIMATLLSVVLIYTAISLSEGKPRLEQLASVIKFGFIVTAANTCLALIGVLVVWHNAYDVWLLAVPAITLVFAYRAYVGERQKHESLDFLYQSARMLHESSEIEAAVLNLLGQAREAFHAEVAELLILPPKGEHTVLRTSLGPGEETQVMVPCDPEESSDLRAIQLGKISSFLWTETAPADTPLHHSLSRRRLRDAMVTRLSGEHETMGVLLVANRLGEVSTFDPADLKLFETLAGHVGVALENGRLEKSLVQLTALKEELRHRAFHDSLTELANRALFSDRIQHALSQLDREERPVTVVFLDIDDFKTINDSLGHAAGDELLVVVANRLRMVLRSSDTAARLGGDEFAVLIPDAEDDAYAIQVVERIMAIFDSPVVLQGREIPVRASLGVAFGRSARENAEELVRNADLAMYRAKSRGKGCYELFEPGLHQAALARMELKGFLQRSLEEREDLFLLYQPIVSLKSGEIVAVEALARWHHPHLGTLSPEHFIPLAEETGLILPLGRMVLEEACRQAVAWSAEGGVKPVAVSVNLSPRQLQDPALAAEVGNILGTTGCDPSSIILEMTETILMQDAEAGRNKLGELKELGLRLAIDDFGKGYSSLSYLKSFPIDIVKIPIDFVHGLGKNPEDSAVAEAIVQIAGALHLSVVGEGIETPSQWAELRELGCDLGQGHYFARPLDARSVEELLRASGPLFPDPAQTRAEGEVAAVTR